MCVVFILNIWLVVIRLLSVCDVVVWFMFRCFCSCGLLVCLFSWCRVVSRELVKGVVMNI